GLGPLSAGIPLSGTAAGPARLVACPPAAGLRRRKRSLVARPQARSDTEPDPALWPGAGAGSGVAAAIPPAACAFHSHPGLRHPVCRQAIGPSLERVGSCAGYLDHAGMGEA